MSMSIGSLFSGIGGLELGLERGIRNGAHTVWQVEQNAYCRAVLAKHWPDATRYEDVKDVGRANLSPVDVLCGGFPCQDISLAGSGAGLAGERSGLWSEYARIVRELRPRYVVVENVAALLARGLGDVLGDLAESGYDAWWDCLPASAVGAPHQRDRLFVVAYTQHRRISLGRRTQTARRVVRDESGISRDVGPRVQQQARTVLADANGGRLEVGAQLDREPVEDSTDRHPRRRHAHRLGNEISDAHRSDAQGFVGEFDDATRREVSPQRSTGLRSGTGRNHQWTFEPSMGRVAHGVRGRVDRIKALGKAVVPQVAEVVGRLIAEREAERQEAA